MLQKIKIAIIITFRYPYEFPPSQIQAFAPLFVGTSGIALVKNQRCFFRVSVFIFEQDVLTAVCGEIIHKDDIIVFICLVIDAFESLLQVWSMVVVGNDDGDVRKIVAFLFWTFSERREKYVFFADLRSIFFISFEEAFLFDNS